MIIKAWRGVGGGGGLLPAVFEGSEDVATVFQLLHGYPHDAQVRSPLYRDVLRPNSNHGAAASVTVQVDRCSLLVALAKQNRTKDIRVVRLRSMYNRSQSGKKL